MRTSSLILAVFLSVVSAGAFTIKPNKAPPQATRKTTTERREFFTNAAAAILTGSATLATTVLTTPPNANAYNLGDPNSIVGREIQSFNGLIYNFKNTALNGGLDASTLNEPSVPFIEFGERMKAGEVEFVEFFAPNGDKAYVTFKPKKGEKVGERIRIGQGYPTERRDSWSSPAYVIRSVSNFGVPYKFTVPMLEKYRS